MIKEIRNPDMYHGWNKKRNFFEGWYFKIADRNSENVFAVIPGMSKGKTEEHSHSFIQFLNGMETRYSYVKFNAGDFACSRDEFKININDNAFSLNGIHLNLNSEEVHARGQLLFNNMKKWPDTFMNPGSMGFYNYLAFMECYSQVCALDGTVQGCMDVNGRNIDFTGGRVYVEKNWGKAFPRSWIWTQSNSFKDGNVAFTCSMGTVPFMVGSFNGFLAGLMIDHEFYSFTSMNGSKVAVERKGRDVCMLFSRRNLRLKVETSSAEDKFMLCMGPHDGQMIPLVRENLKGKVFIELTDAQERRTIFSGTGMCTGIEYGGEFVF